MVILLLIALSGIFVGGIAAFFTKNAKPPPPHILIPALLLGIFIILIVMWMQLPSAVELPSFLKK